MKILWVTNLPLQDIASEVGVKSNLGGWIVALSNYLRKKNDIDFVYCFPQNINRKTIKKRKNGILYYGFYEDLGNTDYDGRLEFVFNKIVCDEKPDVIHIFGTEYMHSLAFINSHVDKRRVIISLQGIVSIIAKHYCTGIPIMERYFPYPYRKGIRSIEKEKRAFDKKGKNEIELLRKALYCDGRTEFDEACVTQINPNIKYFTCRRILRDEFYNRKWSYENCIKHSIFLSQASYPVKGLHLFLEAASIVSKKVDDLKIFIAGTNIFEGRNLITNPYSNYIFRLIKKYNLQNNIVFLGDLSENAMCEQYLQANVFVMPSVIENSPNSLGEAMILGVPSIASDVGGVCSMVHHGIDGYTYRVDAPYMLAYYILRIFYNKSLAINLSKNAQKSAGKMFNPEKNLNAVLELYKTVIESMK